MYLIQPHILNINDHSCSCKVNTKLCIMQTHKWNINEIPSEYIKPINSWKSQNFNYIYSNTDAYNYLLKHFGQYYALILVHLKQIFSVTVGYILKEVFMQILILCV